MRTRGPAPSDTPLTDQAHQIETEKIDIKKAYTNIFSWKSRNNRCFFR